MKRKASNVEILLLNGIQDDGCFRNVQKRIEYEAFLETLPEEREV